MKRIEKCKSIKVMKLAVLMICAFLIFMGQKTISMADSTGKVKQNAKVRQSADINSAEVGGLSQGTTVTITNEVNDASGTVWYQISSGGTQGYVRSDLIEKTDSTDAAATQTTTTVSSTASGAEVEPETALDLQYATVKASPKAKVRSKASTSGGTVDSLPQNTPLIISGQTNGSDGVWYYVTFTGTSGSEKTGYIRNDLITLGDMVPVEEPPVEEPEAPEEPQVDEPVVKQDYAVVYEDPNDEGQYAWWLHDYTGEQATRQKVEDLLKATYAQSVNSKIDAATISKQRIAIVILVALVIILAVLLTCMFFKLRDAYIGEEEDDSDNWKAERRIKENRENRENREGRSNRSSGSSGSGRSGVDRQEGQVRRKSTSSDSQQPPVRKKPMDPERKAPAKEVTYEDDGTERPKPAPKKKAKNFLADDDDFEFEFLNMKDKDKGDD